jgi:thymidylate kinase
MSHKLILLDGGPASGKNTLGSLLVEELRNVKNIIILLDLDTYVEEINPTWVWENKQLEELDQLKARENFAIEINKYLQEKYTVIVIGERFLTNNDIVVFISRLKTICTVYLYHLSIPISLRKERLNKRGPHSLIDLEKDQKDRDNIKIWPGYVYKNINSPIVDAKNLMKLIQDGIGMIGLTINRSAK